jgi:hypothetical protein
MHLALEGASQIKVLIGNSAPVRFNADEMSPVITPTRAGLRGTFSVT